MFVRCATAVTKSVSLRPDTTNAWFWYKNPPCCFLTDLVLLAQTSVWKFGFTPLWGSFHHHLIPLHRLCTKSKHMVLYPITHSKYLVALYSCGVLTALWVATYVVCLKSMCTDFLFQCLLDSPAIAGYLLQSMILGKLHNDPNFISSPLIIAVPWSHFLQVCVAHRLQLSVCFPPSRNDEPSPWILT